MQANTQANTNAQTEINTEMAVYHVKVFWDEAVAVWVATSEDIPGLTTEVDTIEALSQKLRAMVPELLLSNHAIAADH